MQMKSILRTAVLGAAASGVIFAQATPATPATPTTPAERHARMGRRMAGRHMRAGRGHAFQQLMSSYLNLTDAQKSQMATIRSSAQAQAKPVREQLRQNRQQLNAAIQAGQPTDALAAQQGQLLGKLIAIRAGTRAQMRAVLTPEQVQKLQQLRGNAKGGAQSNG